jgi:YVTN family beta-propeller protein
MNDHPRPPDCELLVVFKLSSCVAWLDPGDLHGNVGLTLPEHPHEVLVDQAAGRAYVSIYGNGIYGNNTQAGNQVAVLDLSERRLQAMVDLGENRGPHGFALDGDGNVWVSCDRTGTLVVIDAVELKVIDVVEISGWATPHWIVTTPDGVKAYTANKATPYLSVIDTRTRAVTAVIPAPTGVEGLSVDSTGARLYAADHSGAGLPSSTTHPPVLRVIDVSSDEVTDTVPLGLSELDAAVDHEVRVRVAPDDGHILVSAYRWNQVLLLDPGDPYRQRSIPVPGGPMGFAFPPGYGIEHRQCLVTNHDTGALTRLDVEDARVLETREPAGVRHDGPETLEFVAATPTAGTESK